ncbi:MAG: hydroxyacid dehydrogenase [Spirochaetales bacterium]|nr:hydroxyacid dehydrogenase [Spirochaetales bacterium]
MKINEVLNKYNVYDKKIVKEIYTEEIQKANFKIIVLDDDPTGVQTVHDVYVYTKWDYETILEAFNDEKRVSFILTNSRGLTRDETVALHREVAESINKASVVTGKDYLVMSRSDSTLRGHYPLETEVLETTLSGIFDGEIVMPFFLEGGRYTVNDMHYVLQKEELIPAGETEFAKDKTFGYKNSDLKKWIEERTEGRVKKDDVLSISLESLRNLDINGITNTIESVKDFNKIVVNALSYEDVMVFSSCLMKAIRNGKRFICRCAASLVRVLGGVTEIPLLTNKDVISEEQLLGGLVIAGSHVKKTTKQLNSLLELENTVGIELNQHLVVNPIAFEEERIRVIHVAREIITSGKTAVVYTKRERFDLNTGNKEDELLLAKKISDAVTSVVSDIGICPSFIIAKGGITSSEIGTKALRCRKALVLGQIKKGIPVWKTGEESLYPGISYIIFPGNVGDDDTLKDIVKELALKCK